MIVHEKNLSNCILTWRYDIAPSMYKELCKQGGDEDWIVFVPDSMSGYFIPFVEILGQGSIGCCSIDEIKIEGGKLFVGTHA